MQDKVINDVDIMVLFAHCVDDNTLAIIYVNNYLLLCLLLYLDMHTGMCNCKVSPHHEYA